LIFAAGAALIAIPAAILLAVAPEQFLFGNLGYPKLSVVWRRYPIWKDIAQFVDPVRGFLDPLHEGMHGLTLDRKLRRVVAVTLRDNWPIFSAFVVALISGGIAMIRTRRIEKPAILLMLALPFVLWGCLAPSRFHVQYFYALMPFLALVTIECCRALAPLPGLARCVGATCVALALVGTGLGASQYATVRRLFDFESWGAVSAHRFANQLRTELGTGRILTLDPMLVAEAGAPIYREVSSGEFGWRTAHLLPLEKRRRLKMVCGYDVEWWLGAMPPDAIVLDWTDPQLTPPLVQWAGSHGFTARTRYGAMELWTRSSSQ
jgi:hypothetical protein